METQLVLKDNKPKYTLGEEVINAISHGIGSLFGILVLILCLVKSIQNNNIIGIITSIVYGLSIITMYTLSTLYHSFKNGKTKSVFRVLDHCTIFVLIAGTYTPFTLITLGSLTIGKVLFFVVWAMSILGIILNAISLKRFAIFSIFCYVVIGWVIVVAIKPLINLLGLTGFLFLLFGGAVYTVGAVIYAIGKKKKYFHSIFHFLSVLGTVLQFISIYLFVL